MTTVTTQYEFIYPLCMGGKVIAELDCRCDLKVRFRPDGTAFIIAIDNLEFQASEPGEVGMVNVWVSPVNMYDHGLAAYIQEWICGGPGHEKALAALDLEELLASAKGSKS